jgi:hypothetical protein
MAIWKTQTSYQVTEIPGIWPMAIVIYFTLGKFGHVNRNFATLYITYLLTYLMTQFMREGLATRALYLPTQLKVDV